MLFVGSEWINHASRGIGSELINDVLRSEGWVSPLGGAESTNNAFPPGINYFDRCLDGRVDAKVAGVARARSVPRG